MCDPPGDKPCNSGSARGWHLAARGVPLGGRGKFHLVALRLRQAIMLLSMAWVCVVLCHDAILGSGDVVP